MIDNRFIQSAREIRRKYLNYMKEIRSYEKDVRDLITFLNEKAKNLEKITKIDPKHRKTQEDIDKLTNTILMEISSIEEEEKKISDKISKINSSLKQLSIEEDMLYQNLKRKYPNFTDEELKNEIQSYLDE